MSLGLLLAAVLSAPALQAQEAGGLALQSMDVQSLPGQRVEVRLQLNGTAPAPMTFTIDDPARIALDLPGTTNALASRRQDVNLGPLTNIMTAEAGGRTRVVLNLASMVPYDTRVQGDTVYVVLGQEPSADAGRFAGQAANAGPSSPAAAATPAAQAPRTIDNIDFRRGADGAGQVIVQLSNPRTAVDVREEGGRVIVDFDDTALPADLMKRFDVTDFATPVATVDALRSDGNARLVVTPTGAYDQVAYQSDNTFTLELKEPQRQQAAGSLFDANKQYSGERLTMNFQDIETRAVLQLLADTSGLNIVVSDSVQGNVTLRLQNVPWDQALDILLTTKGLDMRRNGNVIIVAPAEEIAAREQAQLQAAQALKGLEPLRSEFIQVNYAKASELANLIRGQGSMNSLISDRGSVAIDERTNTLLVQDTADRLTDIRRLVTTLDIPVRQVLIESRIVIVSDDYSRDLGVRFGASALRQSGNNGLVAMTGTGTGANALVSSGTVQSAAPTQRYSVNLPAVNAAASPGSIAFAFLSSDYLLDLELSAIQAEGKGQIISTPHVVTANQKEARISQGVEIPYQQAASSGATTTQFKEAVLSLTVTPQITPDDNIIMDLVVTKDSVGQNVQSATGGQVPSIDTRSVAAQVQVADGETAVLGGIYETEDRDTLNKVPLLGDIPGLGHLFRSKGTVNNKAQLLIFVTPKILREGAQIANDVANN